jgi:4-hydroxybenzoate polyprenyltransferase
MGTGQTAWALARATHLEPTLAVTAITSVLALDAGRGPATGWVAAAVLAGQASVGWSNDLLDRERDRVVGRSDKPVATGALAPATVRRAALLALAAAVPLSLAAGGVAGAVVHLVAIASAWAYNLGLKRTRASVVPYAVSFGLLPAFVTLGAGAGAPPWWATTTAAALGAGAHFTQSLPDLEDDAEQGVRGLPHRLGAAGSLVGAAGLYTAGALVVALAPPSPIGPVGVAGVAGTLAGVVAMLVAGATGRRRLAFRCTLLAALCLVAAFVGGVSLVSPR